MSTVKFGLEEFTVVLVLQGSQDSFPVLEIKGQTSESFLHRFSLEVSLVCHVSCIYLSMATFYTRRKFCSQLDPLNKLGTSSFRLLRAHPEGPR